MTLQFWLALVAITAGGALLSTQAPVNAALARHLGDPMLAAVISFVVGLVLLLAIALVRGAVPSASAMAALPWWAWMGGVLGAYYVSAVILSVPVLGVLTMVTAAVLGQLLGALVLDATGAFGLPVRAISWQRVAAVALAVGALALSRA